MPPTATATLRLPRLAQTILGRGEIAHWFPAGDPQSGGGYSVASFAEPTPIRAYIQSGDIDPGEIGVLGDTTTPDYWLVTAESHGLAEGDHLKRPNLPAGAVKHHSDTADGFRVGEPKASEPTGVAVYKLTDDDRRVDAVGVGTEPDGGWPATRDAVLAASDGRLTAGGGTQ